LDPLPPKVCRLFEDAPEDLVAFHTFPPAHWAKLRSTKNSNRNEGGVGVVGEFVGIRPQTLGDADGCCAVGCLGRVVGAG
jgi:transposase-like protein